MPVRVQYDYEKICDLLEIPYRYATGMSIEVNGGSTPFAVMTIELKRPLTKEEWMTIANLVLEQT